MSAIPEAIAATEKVVDHLRTLKDAVLAAARKRTGDGKDIDSHQPYSERVAYFATEVTAAGALLDYAKQAHANDADAAEVAAIFAAMVAGRARAQAAEQGDGFGASTSLLGDTIDATDTQAFIRAGLADARLQALGVRILERGGTIDSYLESPEDRMTREAVRSFAQAEVAPIAQEIHLKDDLVPESIIQKMAELGFFGLSVPAEYGGQGMGNLAMILTTEELSVASLASAGSLITRPEILTKALLAGGSEEQKGHWLPKIAAGELMVAISVTEPDTGSDVSSVKLRAERGTCNGQDGYFLNGAKAWCTFAGRANIIAMLTRTNPDPKSGAKGLSLFIVPKDSFEGHEFLMTQKPPAGDGGTIHGKADRTPGYRGMHSYTLALENYFVPAANLVGGEGKGFYLQMSGFAAGRLQTGGRAAGLAQAALECAAAYANERKQFGQPIGSYQLTQYKLGRMAVEIAAARQITYYAARLFDENESAHSLEAAMAKLFACDVAVRTTQEAQLLHGGWGFAEEFPICRYVVDALVLPIFEGVKPILELKVIARGLLG